MSDEIDQKLEEKKNEYLKSKGVTINILGQKGKESLTETIETPNKEKLTTEQRLEEMTAKAEDYEAKLKLIAEKKIESELKRLNIPENDADYFRKNPESLRAYELGKSGKQGTSGKGSIGLTREQILAEKGGSGEMEFESHEAMLNYVKEFEPDNYKKLWEKSVQDMKKAPNLMLNNETVYPNALEDVKKIQLKQTKKEQGIKED